MDIYGGIKMGFKIKCKKCGDIIDGELKGRLIWCSCESCAIDETEYYARIIGDAENYEVVEGDSGWKI